MTHSPPTGELVARAAGQLRSFGVISETVGIELIAQVTASQAEVERLKAALKPFAEYCDELNGFLDNHNQPLPDDDGPGWVYVKIGDFRRARAALQVEESKG